MATLIRGARRRCAILAGLGLAACGGGGDDPLPIAPEREAPQAQATPSQARWGALVGLSLVPAAAANLPDGRVLLWSAQERFSFNSLPGSTYTVVFDPLTGSRTERRATEISHNMFCPGTTQLPDGRLLVSGGSSAGDTSLFDPLTGRWSAASGDRMSFARAYQANTLLPDGSVLTLGGSWNGGRGGKHAEVWTEAAGWRALGDVSVDPMVGPDPAGIYRGDNHMWLIPTAHGRVLHAGPSAQMHWIDTRGQGLTLPAGPRGDDAYAINGSTVMYDIGRVLKTGGAPAYEDVEATATAHLIDVRDGTARVRRLPPMAYARAYHNSVVLPNGQVLILGGQTLPKPFNDARSVLVPELWDPATETFTPLPAMATPRNYHSSALLLPDARVLSVGGGLCGSGCAANHADLQILTPHYLLNADGSAAARPAILEAPASAAYGSAATVRTDKPVVAFALVRLSAVTHGINNDQRRIPLTFTATGVNQYRLEVPSNPGIALPGAYMLFALDAQGVPSVARTLRIVGEATPRLQAPGELRVAAGVAVDLPVLASGSGALSYAASGLPPGVTIDPATGRIGGTPTTPGTWPVSLSVSNAAGRVSTEWRWIVEAAAPSAVRHVRFEALSEVAGRPWASMAEFDLLDPAGAVIPRDGWTVTADSQETVGEAAPATNAIDGAAGTFWHTQWRDASPPPPHRLQVDLGSLRSIGGLRVLPRQDRNNGRVADWRLWTSLDAVQWTLVAQGSFPDTAAEQTVHPLSGAPANRAPVLQGPAPTSSRSGEPAALQPVASDPDGDPLSWAASGLPPGLTLDAATGRIAGTPTATGRYAVALQVLDGRGGSAAAHFDWTVIERTLEVQPVAAAPVVSGSTVRYTASATGTGLSYRWDFGDGTPATAASTSPTVSHRYATAGVYEVTLSVTDAGGVLQVRSFLQAVHGEVPSGPRPAQSSAIGLQQPASGNARLWALNADGDSVGVFDAVTLARLGEVATGSAPRTAAVAPDGRLWVANKGSASISVIDLGTRTLVRTLALPRASAPYGIVFAPNGSAAFVALEATGRVLRLDPATGAVQATRDVGPNPRHLSITADGTRLLVSRFISPPLPGEATAVVATTAAGLPRGGELLVLSAATLAIERSIVLRHGDRPDSTAQGRGLPNYLGAAAIAPDGRSAWVPSKQDNLLRGLLRDGQPLDFQNTVRAISSRLDLVAMAEDAAARLDHDNAGRASAVAFHPTGAYFFAALQTSRQIAVVDAARGRELLRLEAGRAPEALAVSADGRRLFTLNFMDRQVQVYDLTALATRGEPVVPTLARLATQSVERLAPAVLRGKQFFYDARDPRLARDGYISCASCHDDGGHDGRTWDFTGVGEGLRNTISLRGRAGAHGPRHWSANFDETQDFEGQIRALAQGTGLMSDAAFATGTRSQPLGLPKAGVSADLDALAAYVASLNRFDASPWRSSSGALTAEAVAGRTVFARSCVGCHGGADFSDSAAGGGLRDIGTLKPSSGQRLGAALAGIDTPTLRDAWATGPYLHDGSAATLAAAIGAHRGLALTATESANVAAYVQQLGGEEPGHRVARYVRLEALSEVNGQPWTSMAEFNLLDSAGNLMNRSGWVVTADSEEASRGNLARAAIDGLATTLWHTRWVGSAPPPPHTFTVDLGAVRGIGGFRYLPRQDAWVNGSIAGWRFLTSRDGQRWDPVASGSFANTRAEKTVSIAP